MKKKILLIIVLIIAGWLVYFDIVSYISYSKVKSEYEITLKNYDKTKQDLDYLQKTMKELELQVANNHNNVPQATSTASH
jgi:cell division protein FtsB